MKIPSGQIALLASLTIGQFQGVFGLPTASFQPVGVARRQEADLVFEIIKGIIDTGVKIYQGSKSQEELEQIKSGIQQIQSELIQLSQQMDVLEASIIRTDIDAQLQPAQVAMNDIGSVWDTFVLAVNTTGTISSTKDYKPIQDALTKVILKVAEGDVYSEAKLIYENLIGGATNAVGDPLLRQVYTSALAAYHEPAELYDGIKSFSGSYQSAMKKASGLLNLASQLAPLMTKQSRNSLQTDVKTMGGLASTIQGTWLPDWDNKLEKSSSAWIPAELASFANKVKSGNGVAADMTITSMLNSGYVIKPGCPRNDPPRPQVLVGAPIAGDSRGWYTFTRDSVSKQYRIDIAATSECPAGTGAGSLFTLDSNIEYLLPTNDAAHAASFRLVPDVSSGGKYFNMMINQPDGPHAGNLGNLFVDPNTDDFTTGDDDRVAGMIFIGGNTNPKDIDGSAFSQFKIVPAA